MCMIVRTLYKDLNKIDPKRIHLKSRRSVRIASHRLTLIVVIASIKSESVSLPLQRIFCTA